jgi:hypothetical protein
MEGKQHEPAFLVPQRFEWDRASLKAFFGTKLEGPAGAKESSARPK